MDVSSATNTYNASNGTQTKEAIKSLGKEDFLKLFTKQLQAQDPMSPMDSTGFTAQLAQFSSLEQLTNINTGLTNMVNFQSSLQNTMTTGLIGKKVKVSGNTVQLNGQADMRYTLPGDAAKVTVSISDASGVVIRRENIANQSAGEHGYLWDGKDQNGNTLPAGRYQFTVDAADNTGKSIGATSLTYGVVTNVAFENNMTYLNIDNGMKVQLKDIREIGGV